MRYDVGWDYMSYVDHIETSPKEILNSRYEVITKYFFLLGNYLDFFPITFALFAFFILWLFRLCVAKNSMNPLLSWLVFYSIPLFFFASLSTIRQSLALMVVLLSYNFLIERQYLKFLALIVISIWIHSSAIIGVLLLPLSFLSIGRLVNFCLLIVSFFFDDLILSYLESLDFVLSTRLIIYLKLSTSKPQLLNYLYYFFGFLNLIFYNRLVKNNERNRLYITLVNFGIIVLNLLSFEPITSLRLSSFFLIFLVYVVPHYSILLGKNNSKLIEIILVILFILISFFYLFIYINAYNEGLLAKISFLPYKTWFFIFFSRYL